MRTRSHASNLPAAKLGTVVALLTAALLALHAPPALAAPETYRIDPEHTTIGFRVSHLVFSKVSGRFNAFEGSLVMDPSDLGKGTVQILIDAASIDTNEPARDKHLRSEDFFDVLKFPKISFESTSVTQPAPKKLQVRGNLTLHGVTKPVTLDVDVLGFGPDGYGAYRAGFEAHARINRQDYGVAWNDVVEGGGLMVGNDVDINLSIEGVRQKTAAPATK